jgi:hypothetical protein
MATNLDFEAAFQANTGDLWIVGRGDNLGDMKLGMMAGTDASITALPDGGWQAAFQANTGNLWIVGTKDNRGDTQLGMMKGTSPCISALPDGGWQAAFQANTGNLWIVGTDDNRGDMKLGMMKGTSPCIAALPDGGWQAAFQANTGNLWIVGTNDNRGDMKLGMMKGTSPSISAAGGGWQAAFQANTGNLWIVGTDDNRGDMKLGMMKGTSPSLSALADGSWQAAFQANTGNLWVVGNKLNPGDLKLGMMAGTSPSMVALPGRNWQAAFQANTGTLWAVGTLGNSGDQGLGMNKTTSPSISANSVYPASYPTSEPIEVILGDVLANSGACTSIYLDTEFHRGVAGHNEENHAQGLARTHLLSDKSVYFFLSYSGIGGNGTVSQYRYAGPVDGEHVSETDQNNPLDIAAQAQVFQSSDEHPSDIVFLPDVNSSDAGYLFVTEEKDTHVVTVFKWQAFGNLEPIGTIKYVVAPGSPGPNFIFIDRVNDYYYLGLAESHSGLGQLFRAECKALFPSNEIGQLQVLAFQPVPEGDIYQNYVGATGGNVFDFPINVNASQVKLIRDSTDQWFLLGFRGDPPDHTEGVDYVDVYPVTFSPFSVGVCKFSAHIIFKPGDTGFNATGTHFVEPSGRLLISSSYRWAEGHLGKDMTRVDECPSSVPDNR